MNRFSYALLLVFFVPLSLFSQNKEKKEDTPKFIKDFLKDGAQSDDGLFTVHQMKDKLYFEIPESLLN